MSKAKTALVGRFLLSSEVRIGKFYLPGAPMFCALSPQRPCVLKPLCSTSFMKKYIPDVRSAVLLIIITCAVAVFLSMGWKWVLFGAIQLLLDTRIIPAESYSQQIFMGYGFFAITWIFDMLSLFVAILIAKWLIARPASLGALKIASFALFILLMVFPGWDSEVFPLYWLMVFVWAIVPSVFFWIVGKKYLT
ncbi:MAG: hypothetical protein JWN49_216 [Parcubacteria group bacterium]|nr:hypothetical protein [Parcubacteria group bacterium]